jgi:nitronate monooxygenase
MWTRTAVSHRLGLRYPLVQGPFGGGLSTPELAAAVSNAGGLGSFGANHLSPEEILHVARQIRGLTDKTFALNLWVSNHDEALGTFDQAAFAAHLARLQPLLAELGLDPPAYPERFGYRFAEQIDALLEARPPVFSFIYGVPPDQVLAACRAAGIITAGTATTVAEAQALDEAGVDLIVASGFEAGGHRAAFIRPAEESLVGTLALIPQVVDRVSAPVIAAGGIADGRGVAAALALGAQGVQLGTAFLACDESGAPASHRARLLGEGERATTLTRIFTGRLARGLTSRLTQELRGEEGHTAPYPAQGWIMQQIRRAALAQGRSDLIAMWAGQSAPLLRHRHATALLAAIVEETEAVLKRLHQGLASASGTD